MILRAGFIVFLGVVVGAMHSWNEPVVLRPNLEKLQGTTLPVQPSATTPAPEVLGLEISVDQALQLYQTGAPFVDAREPNFFAEGHVERAMNLTADQVLPAAQDLARFRPGPIVVYCSGGDCDASHHVVVRLQAIGFTQCHIIKDGFPGWKSKGLPVAVGAP